MAKKQPGESVIMQRASVNVPGNLYGQFIKEAARRRADEGRSASTSSLISEAMAAYVKRGFK